MKLALGLVVLAACGGDDGHREITDAAPMEVDAAPACAVPTGAGTMHSMPISADETWTAAGSPHIVTTDISIKGATVTIEPCATVRVAAGKSIVIGGTAGAPAAAINGRGDATHPITWSANAAGTHWGMLRVFETGALDFESTTLTDGGENSTAQNGGGTIVVVGHNMLPLEQNLKLQNVAVMNSGGFGVNVQSYAAFSDDSHDVVISGAGVEGPVSAALDSEYPLYIAPPALHTIPTGTYTGNAKDGFLVYDPGVVRVDETIHDRGVPYVMIANLSMTPAMSEANGGLLTLTIDPGVTMAFAHGSGVSFGLNLGTSGGGTADLIYPTKLVANGTAQKPIVLTSQYPTKAPGDWGGIQWAGGPPSGNAISNLRIEDAGGVRGDESFGCGPNDNDAAIIIMNWTPADAFMSNLTIIDSAAGGVVSGWVSDTAGPDFKTGNTFTNIGNGCDVSIHKAMTPPACPGNDSIPDCQ
ncbi:MAG: hypothetical protein QM831_05235 [Kofleriaceae bacterium]